MMNKLIEELRKIKPEDVAELPNEIANSNLSPLMKELAFDNLSISTKMLDRQMKRK